MLQGKTVLSLEGINLSFKGLRIFQDLNVRFVSGKVNIIMGENGSGKTTLFNLIAGIIKPEHGKIILNNEDITKLSLEHRAKRGILRSFQEPRVFKFINVSDNCLFSFKHLPFEKFLRSIFVSVKRERDEIKELLEKFNLSDKQTSKGGELSLGNQRLINLITVLNAKGKVFLLDEPLAGINEVFHEPILKRINSLAADNLVLVIEHSKGTVESLKGNLYRLENGKIFLV